MFFDFTRAPLRKVLLLYFLLIFLRRMIAPCFVVHHLRLGGCHLAQLHQVVTVLGPSAPAFVFNIKKARNAGLSAISGPPDRNLSRRRRLGEVQRGFLTGFRGRGLARPPAAA